MHRGAWLSLALLSAPVGRGSSQEPPLATLVRSLPLSAEDCKARGFDALKAQGYLGFLESGNGWNAHARGTSASLVCIPQSGRTVLVIVTAGGQLVKEATRLFDAIRGPKAPPSAHDSTPDSALDAAGSGWTATAGLLAGHPGARYSFWCPPHGAPSAVWGDSVYASESSVCTAAVHAGTLSLESGGNAIIEIRPGQQSYSAARRHGIASRARGATSASFSFVSH